MSSDEILPGTWSDLRDDMADAPDYYWGKDSPHPTSIRAVAGMFEASKPVGRETWLRTDTAPTDAPPRWPTTVSFLDKLLGGGFYGLTCFAGFPGLGKSTLALASGIEAAASLDWNVNFYNAEMGDDEITRRCQQYLTVHSGAADAVENLRIVNVPRGFAVENIIENSMGVAGDDRPLLSIFDSINTCAQLMDGSYLDNLRELNLFCMMSRRISRGAASFLAISELNRTGGAKGMNIEHWADVTVKLKGEKEAGWVKMQLAKTRATQGEKEQHKLVRVHHSSRFLSKEELYAAEDQAANGDPHPHLSLVRDVMDIWDEEF